MNVIFDVEMNSRVSTCFDAGDDLSVALKYIREKMSKLRLVAFCCVSIPIVIEAFEGSHIRTIDPALQFQ